MLQSTFLHIPNVGAKTERALWDQGCRTWNDLLDGIDGWSMGSCCRDDATRVVKLSQRRYEERRHQYFAKALGLAESWRAFPDWRESCVYLDIETDGGQRGDSVTMVGLYDGKEFKCLIKDENLHEFPDLISHYGMIVTFFGASFDLPMLTKKFWNLKFDQIHLDLCPTLKRVGLKGGLKKIEKELGIARGEDTDGLTGYDAVKMWRAWQNGSSAALERLIAYNREDVVNLERLAEIAFAKLRESSVPESWLANA